MSLFVASASIVAIKFYATIAYGNACAWIFKESYTQFFEDMQSNIIEDVRYLK